MFLCYENHWKLRNHRRTNPRWYKESRLRCDTLRLKDWINFSTTLGNLSYTIIDRHPCPRPLEIFRYTPREFHVLSSNVPFLLDFMGLVFFFFKLLLMLLWFLFVHWFWVCAYDMIWWLGYLLMCMLLPTELNCEKLISSLQTDNSLPLFWSTHHIQLHSAVLLWVHSSRRAIGRDWSHVLLFYFCLFLVVLACNSLHLEFICCTPFSFQWTYCCQLKKK